METTTTTTVFNTVDISAIHAALSERLGIEVGNTFEVKAQSGVDSRGIKYNEFSFGVYLKEVQFGNYSEVIGIEPTLRQYQKCNVGCRIFVTGGPEEGYSEISLDGLPRDVVNTDKGLVLALVKGLSFGMELINSKYGKNAENKFQDDKGVPYELVDFGEISEGVKLSFRKYGIVNPYAIGTLTLKGSDSSNLDDLLSVFGDETIESVDKTVLLERIEVSGIDSRVWPSMVADQISQIIRAPYTGYDQRNRPAANPMNFSNEQF